jgi:predicted nucleic acid-binding protein
MITAVDTNILLDLLIPDEEFILASKKLLDKYSEKGQLIICEAVYAELASQFDSAQEIKNFLSDTGMKLVYSNEDSLYLAAERWKDYSRKRKKKGKLQCPACGQKMQFFCSKCKRPFLFRQHIISDFIIGAHAITHADLLLTRDRGFYKTSFNDLMIA